MTNFRLYYATIALLLFCSRAMSQPGSNGYGNVWIQGGAYLFTTTFAGGSPPVNQAVSGNIAIWLQGGHSSICDTSGNLRLFTDGFNIYDQTLHPISNGKDLSQFRIRRLLDGWNPFGQGSIILPFPNGIYRMITATVSDDTCIKKWERADAHATCDLLVYHEVDMNANGGAGAVTRAMVPLLEHAMLSKSRMMACRHGDGKSWWLLKPAADTNIVYKFLFTADSVYGPYVQGFGGAAGHFGNYDQDGQSMFSADGTRYASTQMGYNRLFLADFDRCTGMLSNPAVYPVPPRPTAYPYDSTDLDSATNGLCFSPNGRYLYVSGFDNVQQLDLSRPASPDAWTHLYGADTVWDYFQSYSNIYPGPDGKLYIGNWGGLGGESSVIEHPDSPGIAAGFCRKCQRFPGTSVGSTFRFVGVTRPPCMPNFSLGAANPPCAPASVKGHRRNVNFELAPNPSTGSITVHASAEGVLRFFNTAGTLMYTAAVTATAQKIDLHTLPAGTYTFKFRAAGGQEQSGQLVVLP